MPEKIARRRILVYGGLLAAGLGVGTLVKKLTDSPEAPYKHVYLIVADTLRADRLGCYGYKSSIDGKMQSPSPVMDNLAAEGFVAFNQFSQSCWTQTSMASLLYSRLPRSSYPRPSLEFLPGRRENDFWEVTRRTEGIANGRFSRRIAVQTNGVLIQNPFTDIWDSQINLTKTPNNKNPREMEENRGPSTAYRAFLAFQRLLSDLDRIKRNNDEENIFAYVHLMDPHHPYDPVEEIARRFTRSTKRSVSPNEFEGVMIEAMEGRGLSRENQDLLDLSSQLYDASVYQLDMSIQLLIDGLGKRGLLEDSLLVIASDHGQSLGERGVVGHCQNLYPEETHVPFIMWGKGIPKGAYLTTRTRNTDIIPTISDWWFGRAFLDSSYSVAHGESLLKVLESPRDLEVFSLQDNTHRLPAIRREMLITPGGVCCIKTKDTGKEGAGEFITDEYYNVKEDPEMVSPIDVDEGKRALIDESLTDICAGRDSKPRGTLDETMSPTLERTLRDLGYLN